MAPKIPQTDRYAGSCAAKAWLPSKCEQRAHFLSKVHACPTARRLSGSLFTGLSFFQSIGTVLAEWSSKRRDGGQFKAFRR